MRAAESAASLKSLSKTYYYRKASSDYVFCQFSDLAFFLLKCFLACILYTVMVCFVVLPFVI